MYKNSYLIRHEHKSLASQGIKSLDMAIYVEV